MKRLDGKPPKKRTYRAGKRKCSRCKGVWYRLRGERSSLCYKCQDKCSRCDVELTEETRVKGGNGRPRFQCKKCIAACVLICTQREGSKKKARDDFLVRRYGITTAEYDTILAAQGGVCWICERPATGNRLAVDHRHVLKDKQQNPRDTRTRVRGLLCWRCNGALGKFNDSIEKLRKAADYLQQCPAQQHLKEKP